MEIKKLREKANIGQKRLADAAGVTQGAIAKWETGAALPRADKLPLIADTLGCSIDALYGRARDSAPPMQAAS